MKYLASTIISTLITLHLGLASLHAVRAEDVTITGTVPTGQILFFEVVAPATAIVRQPFPVTITAKDNTGSTTTDVPEDLTVSTTNGGTISPIFINRSEFTDDGVWRGNMSLTRAGPARTIIVRSGSATGQTTIDMTEGPPGITEIIQDGLASPILQKIVEFLTPTATTTAVVTALVSIGNVFLYASYLWTVLLEFLGLRRHRRSWGVVYNAATKEPIPLVVIQLIDVKSEKPIDQRVTDPYGRFGFFVKTGTYFISPSHPDYIFPSKISPEKGDLRYTDLYHGEKIEITDPNTVLAVNIPMDPVGPEVARRRSLLFSRLSFRRVSFLLLVLAVLLQGTTVLLNPTTRSLSLFGGYLTVLLLTAILLRRRRRTWGVVYDEQTKKEIPEAQIFVTQEEDPRFASRKVTDESGHFYLLLPKGTYRLVVQHPSYRFPASAQSFGYKGEPIHVAAGQPLVHVDIPMTRIEGEATGAPIK